MERGAGLERASLLPTLVEFSQSGPIRVPFPGPPGPEPFRDWYGIGRQLDDTPG
jgi:hypothetical protein